MAKDERKLKIAVAINSLVSTTQPAYSNHIQFFFRLGRDYPNVDVCLVNPSRMSIDRLRNMAAEVALDQELDYLLFVDDDVLLPTDGLTKLLNLDADIAAGDVLIRGYPFDHMLFRYTDASKASMLPLKTVPKRLGPLKVDAVGFSFCLIKVSLLKKVFKPFFITGPTNTEDIYFCLKARKNVPDCTIRADTSIQCGHILWAEMINPQCKENYKKYLETQYPEYLKKPLDQQGDRGDAYVKEIKKTKTA